MSQNKTAIQDIRNKINTHASWYHRIELAPGVITPGTCDSKSMLKKLNDLGLPQNANGLRVLDIGCRDGFFAFEMERRGAEVTGIDYAAPDITGFSVAAEILNSKVNYLVENVYDLSPEIHGTFDVVLFLGVLYHLRNPIQGFDAIRGVLKEGGLLFVETQLSTDPAVTYSQSPVWEFFLGDEHNNDDSNKWAPNLAGLTASMTECQFDVLEYEKTGLRGYATGRASVSNRKDFYRQLDSSKDLWGKYHWIDPDLTSEKEINEAGAIQTGALPEKDEYIEQLISRIFLLEQEAEEAHYDLKRRIRRLVLWLRDKIRGLMTSHQ